ncbi:ATP-binding cassette domain-containing protein [Spirochaeta africana]|uniref:ABC-type multidrug transport system, ATPase component n=1 Tax=Spirochaeta africana (strain ATCC 700263 / DSM 8902 / Z-7692) TaxID=889378 RepID=H9UM45_SPIAZ|nr:ATP-binding cassette domain-containing protein [Spirochaeta africana]AFG38588.1 ABC-type multidrug transport system, ATPase component [Spirochaeta africana DSM 8902]
MQFQFYSLELDSVQTAFAPDPPLHAPVQAELRPGKWLALRGPSGTGKTTLLRSALGFSEDYTGSIRMNGEPLQRHTAALLRSVSGYLPQRPYLGQGTTAEVCRDLLRTAVEHQRLEELFPRLGLSPGIRDTAAERLSGGELQRLGLALLLARRPQLLVLDEPTSGLDDGSCAQFLSLLDQMQIGGIFSSHDSRLLQLADHTVVLEPVAAPPEATP